MINPPIEELKEIAGNEYILTCLVSKRAKELEKEIPEVIENSSEKAISIAVCKTVCASKNFSTL